LPTAFWLGRLVRNQVTKQATAAKIATSTSNPVRFFPFFVFFLGRRSMPLSASCFPISKNLLIVLSKLA